MFAIMLVVCICFSVWPSVMVVVLHASRLLRTTRGSTKETRVPTQEAWEHTVPVLWYVTAFLAYTISHKSNFILGAIHNCQLVNECTKHTFSDSLPPSKSVHNIFQINNLPQKKRVKMLKVYRINFFFQSSPKRFCTLGKMLTIMDGPIWFANTSI